MKVSIAPAQTDEKDRIVRAAVTAVYDRYCSSSIDELESAVVSLMGQPLPDDEDEDHVALDNDSSRGDRVRDPLLDHGPGAEAIRRQRRADAVLTPTPAQITISEAAASMLIHPATAPASLFPNSGSDRVVATLDRKFQPPSPAPNLEGWQDISSAPKGQSVIICTWWKHSLTSAFRAEGYLDRDTKTWLNQDGSPISEDRTQPTHWQAIPAAPASEGSTDGH